MRSLRPSSYPPDTPAPDVSQRAAVLPDAPDPEPTTNEPTSKVDHSVLGQIERAAIAELTVTMPSTVIHPDRPSEPMVMLDVRERLMRGKFTQEAVDAAWRRLAELARTSTGAERGEWNLFALGMAYPLLRQKVMKVRDDMTGGEKGSAHFAIAREFLFALHRLDLSGAHVFNRLVDAAYTHATGRKRRPPAWTAVLDPNRRPKARTAAIDPSSDNPDDDAPDDDESSDDGSTADHAEANTDTRTPADVLDEVVTRANSTPGRQRITDVQAALITRTYLDRERLRDVGAEYGLSEPSASKQRRRAANTIARLLGRPGLAE